MTKKLVISLEGQALNAAVAIVYSAGFDQKFFDVRRVENDEYHVYSCGYNYAGLGYESQGELVMFDPSTKWEWAGPLLEECDTSSFWHGVANGQNMHYCRLTLNVLDGGRDIETICYGPTKLTAFCRAYVSLVYKSTIELPDSENS